MAMKLVALCKDDASRAELRTDARRQVLGLAEDFTFPAHTVIMYSSRARASRLHRQRLQRLCRVKRFRQRRPDAPCQLVKRIYHSHS